MDIKPSLSICLENILKYIFSDFQESLRDGNISSFRVVARVKYKDRFLKISFNRYDNTCLFNAFGFLSRN